MCGRGTCLHSGSFYFDNFHAALVYLHLRTLDCIGSPLGCAVAGTSADLHRSAEELVRALGLFRLTAYGIFIVWLNIVWLNAYVLSLA